MVVTQMQTIEILASVMLQAMLEKLQLPCPKYEHRAVGEDQFVSKVILYLFA